MASTELPLVAANGCEIEILHTSTQTSGKDPNVSCVNIEDKENL